jgi:hypothetical protein
MLIFVFDPLAITLVIATNQAFDRIKPKMNIYGEPKPIEPTPTSNPDHIPVPPIANINKQKIIDEIQKVKNSNVSSKKKGTVLESLKKKLSSLNNNDTKTY